MCVAYDPSDPESKARAAVGAAAAALSSTTCRDYKSCAATAAPQLRAYGACSAKIMDAAQVQNPDADAEIQALRGACGLPAQPVKDLASGCRAVLAMYDRQAAVDICDPSRKTWAQMWRSLSPSISRSTCTIDPLLLQSKSARLFACSISGPLTSEAATIAASACAGGARGVTPLQADETEGQGSGDADGAACVENAENAAKVLGASASAACVAPGPDPAPPPAPRKRVSEYWTWKNIGIAVACVVGVSIVVASIAALSSALSQNSSNSRSTRKQSGKKRGGSDSVIAQPVDGVDPGGDGSSSSAAVPGSSMQGTNGAGVLDISEPSTSLANVFG